MTFPTATDALAEWTKEQDRRETRGSSHTWSNAQIAEAETAISAAEELGASLSEIVDYYRQAQRRESLPTLTYDQAVKLALSQPLRPVTKTALKSRWMRFRLWLQSRHPKAIENLAAVTQEALRVYIAEGTVTHRTMRNRRDELSTLFRTAVESGKLPHNPCSAIQVRVPRRDHAVAILTAEQAERLLRITEAGFSGEYHGKHYHSPPYECSHMIALGLFAGLRPNEILALDWEDIKIELGHIDLAAKKTKKGNRRLIPIPPNLVAWLAKYPSRSGNVRPENWQRKFRVLALHAELRPWPHDCLRHSFASYHYAHHRNLGETMAQMGHKDAAVFFQHYQEFVRSENAAKYWKILPPI